MPDGRPVTLEAVLAEVEDLARTAPPVEEFRQQSPVAIAWAGRAITAITHWNGLKGIEAHNTSDNLFTGHDPWGARTKFLVLLQQASSDLRLRTLGPLTVAMGAGQVFDYFDAIAKLIESAATEILFVDRYLDADFVGTYLSQSQPSVLLRLLTRDKLPSLLPAARLFSQQRGQRIEVRSSPHVHDRYLIVDRQRCYQSGASFKDGARGAPTTVTQIVDAFGVVQGHYEAAWSDAKVEL